MTFDRSSLPTHFQELARSGHALESMLVMRGMDILRKGGVLRSGENPRGYLTDEGRAQADELFDLGFRIEPGQFALMFYGTMVGMRQNVDDPRIGITCATYCGLTVSEARAEFVDAAAIKAQVEGVMGPMMAKRGRPDA